MYDIIELIIRIFGMSVFEQAALMFIMFARKCDPDLYDCVGADHNMLSVFQ